MKQLRDIVLPFIEEIKSGKKSLEVSELWGATKALFLFSLQQESGRPVTVVTATEEEAATLVEDLKFFRERKPVFIDESPEKSIGTDISLFPCWGVLPFEADSPDSGTVGERMGVLYKLISCIYGVRLKD